MSQREVLSSYQYFILLILQNSSDNEVTGSNVLQKFNNLIFDKVSPGAVYRSLKVLAQYNLIEEKKIVKKFLPDSNRGRKLIFAYTFLPAGETAITKHEEISKSLKNKT